MARKKESRSEIVSSLGTAFEVLKSVTDRLKLRGGSDDDLRAVLRDPALAEKVAELIWRRGGEERFYIRWPHNTNASELLAASDFDEIDFAVRKHFQGKKILGGYRGHFRFFHDYGHSKTPEQLRERIKARGWRPATATEFLFLISSAALKGTGHFFLCLEEVPIPPTAQKEPFDYEPGNGEKAGYLFARCFSGGNKDDKAYLTVLSAGSLHQPWHLVAAVEETPA